MVGKIVVFESGRGEKIIEKFIKKLNPKTVAKIIRSIDLLEKYGTTLGMPHSKKLEMDLFELRVRGKEEIRIIYIFFDEKIYLLHAFKKKTQKIRPKEIKTALLRRKNLR